MKKNRKLLSLLMAIAMVMALLPATSIFAEGLDSLKITQSVDKKEFSGVGETITYTYTFTNTGVSSINGPFTVKDTLTNTNIPDDLFPNSLEPEESFTVTVKNTITQEDIDEWGDHIDNIITLEAPPSTTGPGLTILRGAAITIHRGPGLTIEKSADKSFFSAVGETITYTYTVTHTGPGETIVGSADGPAPGPFILRDDKIGDQISSGNITELTQNESFTVTADYQVTQADITRGSITNKVIVQGSYLDYPDDPIQAETELTIPIRRNSGPADDYRENPSLKLEKSANKKDFSEVGEIITYTYIITNTGNTLVRGDFYGFSDESFKLTDDKIATIDMSKTPTELNPGKSFTVTAPYTVSQADLDAGEIKNLAKVSGISGNNTIEATDTVTILAKKKEVPDEPKEPSIGDKLNMEDHFQYISGYPGNTVKPDGLITREEVAAVFYRLLTSNYRNSINTKTHHFEDVQAGRWSEESIATLSNANIIIGYEDGTFRPGNSITRAELAAVASRFDRLIPFTSNKFSDIENHWANQVINSASKKGWVNGYSDGTFRPNQYMTRAESVALVNNVLNRGVKKENILPNAKQFPDLLESK